MCYESRLFPARMVSPEVSARDQKNFAVRQFVKIFAPRNSYFAHEHGEPLMGGA